MGVNYRNILSLIQSQGLYFQGKNADSRNNTLYVRASLFNAFFGKMRFCGIFCFGKMRKTPYICFGKMQNAHGFND